jgi:hypothetical protein
LIYVATENERMTMLNRMVREKLRDPLLIGAVVTALTAGTTAVIAQVDDPPGARFQTQGIRESMGVSGIPSPYSRRRHAPEIRGLQRLHAYAYSPHHVIVRPRTFRY